MEFMRSLNSKLLWFFLFNILTLCASQNGTTFQWVLQETSFTRLCNTKQMLTVNGMFPGPTLNVTRGDTIFVNVTNQGSYNVTIHWHGVKQLRNPWSDGPDYVTQCPIMAGKSFVYEIVLSTEEGTLWWHAHSDYTRATIHGAIIVKPQSGESYPYPTPHDEHLIILGPWFNGDVMELYEEAVDTGAEFNKSDAVLINSFPGDLYNTSSCPNPGTYTLPVDSNRTYLLRVINAVMNEEKYFAIAGHSLRVVGADGAYLKPIDTEYIMITPGQTMDILITTNQTPSDYYMGCSSYGIIFYHNITTTAILRYNENHTTPSSIPLPILPDRTNDTAALNFTRLLKSLADAQHPVDVPTSIDKQMVITVSMGLLPCATSSCNDTRLAASMNNHSFVLPQIDILSAYYNNISSVYTPDFPSLPSTSPENATITPINDTTVTVLEYNSNVEMVFQGTNVLNGSEMHPIHVHGYSFYMVGVGDKTFDNTTDPATYNLVDPPLMNTVALPLDGWVAIRFKADNPGVWFIHCHLERHAVWGMATVLIVKNGSTEATSMRPPPSYLNPC